jgi:ferredoxin-NADP reductase
MPELYTVTLLMSEFVTHDVKRFVISRPPGFTFTPGQGVELAINQPEWRDERRPFTPTCLVDDRVLEFTIKGYPEHKGMTRELHGLSAGAELLMSAPFGTISYQGPGVFLAGGAGITPFLAILRERARAAGLDRHALIFSNKTPADVICEKELRHYLDERCILTCTEAQAPGYEHRRLDKAFLAERIEDFDQHFYVCGPPGFIAAVNAALEDLGAAPQSLVFER